MENVIFEICLRTDYETTIKLLRLYARILNKYNNIWKLKCYHQFPNKPYFDLWTGAENYLMCTKQKFMIVLYKIKYGHQSLPYLYEYDKMLKDIYNTRLCSCYDNDIIQALLFLDNKDSKFVIITAQDGYKPSFVNFYDSLDKCIKWIEDCENLNFWASCDIYIIDINKMIPSFWGKKSRKHDLSKPMKDHVFYYKFINDKLVQLMPESYL